MRWGLEKINLGGTMLKFNEILIVFFALIGLGLSGYPLKQLERAMGHLAVEASENGYMSLGKFNRQLIGKKK